MAVVLYTNLKVKSLILVYFLKKVRKSYKVGDYLFKKEKFPYKELVNALSEITYAMKKNKSFEVRLQYINNAIYHLKEAVTILNERK